MNAKLLIGGVLVVAALLVASITVNALITYHLIQQRETVWCPLLSSFHAPPHPTAEQAKGFAQIASVRRGLGCQG